MIDLVLNKGFVLAEAEVVLKQLEAPSFELAIEDSEEAARTEVASELAEAIAAEGPVKQLALEELEVEDRKAYLPSNRILSMLQTAMEERLREEHPDLLRPAFGPTGPGGPGVTAMYIGPEELLRDLQFAAHIARALLRRRNRKPHGFVEATPPPTFDLAADARIVLVGDWGMGNPSAHKIRDLIKQELDAAGSREAHLIHLGDVYYSGEISEAQKHVLNLWPIKAGETNRWSWALNGNHDMYSGGFGYFDTILGDPRFAAQQGSAGKGVSYFLLRNDHWQFLGLDTAWELHLFKDPFRLSGWLNKPQAKWAKSCLQPADGLRTILLTHHQHASSHHHGQLGGNLPKQLKPLIDGPRGVDAWFWGHEHICERFPNKQKEVRYGACVGHGSIPQPLGHASPDPGGWEYDQGYPDEDGHKWRWCGFAVLDLKKNGEIDVRYLAEDGSAHHPEKLPV